MVEDMKSIYFLLINRENLFTARDARKIFHGCFLRAVRELSFDV